MRVGDSNKSATALRALSVMEILASAGRPVSVADVAAGIGADRSTAYRMLMTLLEAGYVARDESLKTYRLGFRLLSLTRNLLTEGDRSKLVAEALTRISGRTGETVHYCVHDGDATVLVQRVKGTQLVAVDFQIGDRSPLHCTSIGKAILAFQDVRKVEVVIAKGLPRVAEKTIVDPARFRKELEKIRMQGYAFDDREFHDDMRCVAVPIFEKDGTVTSGISLSGPASRYTLAKLDQLRVEAADAARDLSRQLGGGSISS
jgi:DNA-binding IclR family transcriptional regulator